MWIVCQADDAHAVWTYILYIYKKKKKKKKLKMSSAAVVNDDSSDEPWIYDK